MKQTHSETHTHTHSHNVSMCLDWTYGSCEHAGCITASGCCYVSVPLPESSLIALVACVCVCVCVCVTPGGKGIVRNGVILLCY